MKKQTNIDPATLLVRCKWLSNKHGAVLCQDTFISSQRTRPHEELWDLDDDDDEEEYHSWLYKKYGPEMPYTYRHPDYPKEIQLSYPWIQDELSKTENALYLKDELTDRILALPHDALRQDLEDLIMYHIGLTCDSIPEGYDDGQYNGLLSSCLRGKGC
jgi:hypothetical protein